MQIINIPNTTEKTFFNNVFKVILENLFSNSMQFKIGDKKLNNKLKCPHYLEQIIHITYELVSLIASSCCAVNHSENPLYSIKIQKCKYF